MGLVKRIITFWQNISQQGMRGIDREGISWNYLIVFFYSMIYKFKGIKKHYIFYVDNNCVSVIF